MISRGSLGAHLQFGGTDCQPEVHPTLLVGRIALPAVGSNRFHWPFPKHSSSRAGRRLIKDFNLAYSPSGLARLLSCSPEWGQ